MPNADLQRTQTAVEDTSAFLQCHLPSTRPLLPSATTEAFLKILPSRPYAEFYRVIIIRLQAVSELGK